MEGNSALTMQKLLEGQNRILEGQQQLHAKFDSVVSQLRSEVDCLKKENQKLKKSLQDVTARLDKQEQHSRSKNIVIYDVPGPAGENRHETQAKVLKIAKALNVDHKVVVTHRLSPASDSPIVATFESKVHAQEMLSAIRQTTLTAAEIEPKSHEKTAGRNKKIVARPHLCPALVRLQKAAAALKAEANWGWTKIITSRMEVQIYKGTDSDGNVLPPIIVRSLEDVVNLRLQLVEQGVLPDIAPVIHLREPTSKKRAWTGTAPGNATGLKEERIV